MPRIEVNDEEPKMKLLPLKYYETVDNLPLLLPALRCSLIVSRSEILRALFLHRLFGFMQDLLSIKIASKFGDKAAVSGRLSLTIFELLFRFRFESLSFDLV